MLAAFAIDIDTDDLATTIDSCGNCQSGAWDIDNAEHATFEDERMLFATIMRWKERIDIPDDVAAMIDPLRVRLDQPNP